MGRKANGNSIEIQPGLYLSSHEGLLHCYFRIEGRAFRRSTRTDDTDEATRLLGWSRLRLKPGERASVNLTADPRLLADFDTGRRA